MKTVLTLTFAAGIAAAMAGCSSPVGPEPVSDAEALAAPVSAAQPAPASEFGPSILLKVPGDSPGPPFYALSGNGGFVPHDGQWAVFPFVRELGCVPPAQDLLVLAAPAAFGCALTVEGHEHWQNGPGIDPAPRQTQFHGLGSVPMIFARWSEVQTAMSGGLEFTELMALPSVRPGTASFYKETNVLGISGPHGAGKGSYTFSARGRLADQTPFSVLVNEVLGELRVVQIRFR
jgi:hypothetical protein